MKVANLDDYQNAALGLADWSAVGAWMESRSRRPARPDAVPKRTPANDRMERRE
jgi:hypothetical protein